MGRDEGRSSPPPLLPTGSPLPPAVRLARDGHTRSAAGMAKEKETQGSRKLKKKKSSSCDYGRRAGTAAGAAPRPASLTPSPPAPARPPLSAPRWREGPPCRGASAGRRDGAGAAPSPCCHPQFSSAAGF